MQAKLAYGANISSFAANYWAMPRPLGLGVGPYGPSPRGLAPSQGARPGSIKAYEVGLRTYSGARNC